MCVDILPGGFWIDYIRPGLEDGQSIVAAPVTGSLVSSALFSCLFFLYGWIYFELDILWY